MADYVLTKDVARATKQLPDKLTVRMPASYAWVVLKRLLIQLEQCKSEVELELFGTMENMNERS